MIEVLICAIRYTLRLYAFPIPVPARENFIQHLPAPEPELLSFQAGAASWVGLMRIRLRLRLSPCDS